MLKHIFAIVMVMMAARSSCTGVGDTGMGGGGLPQEMHCLIAGSTLSEFQVGVCIDRSRGGDVALAGIWVARRFLQRFRSHSCRHLVMQVLLPQSDEYFRELRCNTGVVTFDWCGNRPRGVAGALDFFRGGSARVMQVVVWSAGPAPILETCWCSVRGADPILHGIKWRLSQEDYMDFFDFTPSLREVQKKANAFCFAAV